MRVSTHVTTPEQCSSYALSDPKDQAFRSDCARSHVDRCLSCEVLKGAVKQIGNAVAESPLMEDEQDDMQYAFRLAVQAIESWKAHQLRSLQQDKARSTVLESLDESSVLITQDWAIKWLPQRYRETQADWFGKRGISWHVSVVVRRLAGQLEQQTFVHILEESSQDADAVVRVLQYTLRSLKVEQPEIKFAALRQDNAGCYHSVTRVTVWTRRQKRMVKGRMLARYCHALLRDAYAPIRGTTTWNGICSSGSASSFQRSIPF